MRKFRRYFAILIGLILIALTAIYIFRDMPAVAASAIRNADSFELLSLDPERNRDDADFHQFKILGRTMVNDPATRRRLYDALQSATRWNAELPAACFMPRHGIRVISQGRAIDLVICFECSQVQVWEGNTRVEEFIVGDSPEPLFDQLLRDANITLAPKAK